MINEQTKQLADWLEAARKGDRSAFSNIVRIMMKPIVALTYRMTRDSEAARDLAQDTFLAAWENLADFRGESKLESWLYRIATNKTLNYINRKRPEPLDDLVTSQIADQAASPEESLQQKQLKQAVLDFMETLPPQQRLVFNLRFYRQMSFDEIARVTGKSLGTCKTNYREAVMKLREHAKTSEWYDQR